MAVLDYEELPGSTWENNEDGTRATTRRFLVKTDLNDHESTAVAGVPIGRGTTHPSDTGITAKKADGKRYPDDSSLGLFLVTFYYDNKPWGKGSDSSKSPTETGADVDPLSRPLILDFDDVSVDSVLAEDKADTPVTILNPVGEPFDPPLIIPTYHEQITISGYQDISIDPGAHKFAYLGKINGNDYAIAGHTGTYSAYTLLCVKDKWTEEYFAKTDSWAYKVEIVLQFNPDFWHPFRVACTGTRELLTTGYTPILDKTGHPITKPMRLHKDQDMSGEIKRLEPGESTEFLEFQVYKFADFSGLLT